MTWHYITIHYITLHYFTLHCITLNYITLHCTTLQYIALHCLTLHMYGLSLAYVWDYRTLTFGGMHIESLSSRLTSELLRESCHLMLWTFHLFLPCFPVLKWDLYPGIILTGTINLEILGYAVLNPNVQFPI